VCFHQIASAGVGLFLSSRRRPFSGGVLIKFRSLLAMRACQHDWSPRCLTSPAARCSKVAIHFVYSAPAPLLEALEGGAISIHVSGARAILSQVPSAVARGVECV
jgi:hypothetical protein